MRTNDAGRPEHSGHVVLTHNVDASVAELAVRGQWTRKAAVAVYEAMRKCLAEHPVAVIIDLHEMSDLDASSVSTWIAASQAAMQLQPPAQVALCAPPTRQVVIRLRQLGCTRFLSLFVNIDQARAAVADAQPLTDRLQLRWLRPHPDSFAAVRDIVALACRLWAMPTLASAAQEVALDLVDDSATHARTPMLFTVTRHGGSLYLSLRDHDSTLPPLRREQASGVGAKRGPARLPLVDARSFVWGASTTHDGKVVWAIVRP